MLLWSSQVAGSDLSSCCYLCRVCMLSLCGRSLPPSQKRYRQLEWKLGIVPVCECVYSWFPSRLYSSLSLSVPGTRSTITLSRKICMCEGLTLSTNVVILFTKMIIFLITISSIITQGTLYESTFVNTWPSHPYSVYAYLYYCSSRKVSIRRTLMTKNNHIIWNIDEYECSIDLNRVRLRNSPSTSSLQPIGMLWPRLTYIAQDKQ